LSVIIQRFNATTFRSCFLSPDDGNSRPLRHLFNLVFNAWAVYTLGYLIL
jgi:hypothetical protein